MPGSAIEPVAASESGQAPSPAPPPALEDALGRLLSGTQRSGDVRVLSQAVESGHLKFAPEQPEALAAGDRAVTINGNANGAIVVTGDGNLVVRGATAEEVAEAYRRAVASWRRLLIVLVAAVVVTGAAGALAVVWLLTPQTVPFSGDINVAVAAFGEADGRGGVADSAAGAELARSFAGQLEKELQALNAGAASVGDQYVIEVRDLTARGRVPGVSADEQEQNATGWLGRDQGVSPVIVVVGLLEPATPRGTKLVVRFSAPDDLLPYAEDALGQHTFGLGQPVNGNPGQFDTKQQLRARLLNRARALAEFIVGLADLKHERLPAAAARFEAAERAYNRDGLGTAEVLPLFVGTVALRQGDLARARESYQRALGMNREYARAYIGKAEVSFQEGRADCTRGRADQGKLRDAIADVDRASQAADQTPEADIPAKVSWYRSRAYLCLSLAGGGAYWAEAERDATDVVSHYEGGSEKTKARLRPMASESHANLGFLYERRPAASPSDRAEDLRRAVAEYQAAAELNRAAADAGQRVERQLFFERKATQLEGELSALAPAPPTPRRIE
jgi:tetratricopeptide (TPR) repeat protein